MADAAVAPTPERDRSGASALAPGHAILALVVILGLAAALRLGGLGSQSLWWDEVTTWQQARLGFAAMLAATAADNYPPLFNLLVQLSLRLFGDGEVALRLPAALLGISGVAAIYWVGRMLGGRAAGLIAALLLALSGLHVWYSGEARMYALLGCAATLCAGTLVRYLARPGRGSATAMVLAATALLYSHPYGALTWAALCCGAGLVLLRRRRPGALLRLAALQMLPLLLFAPWAVLLAGRAAGIAGTGFWIPPLAPLQLLQMLAELVGGPLLLAALGIGLRLCLVRPAGPPLLRPGSPLLEHRDAMLLLGFWATGPLLAGIGLSLAFEPMLITRYLLGLQPALLLVIALGAVRLPRTRAGIAGLALLGVAALSGLAFAPHPREDFRGVGRALAAELQPGDCVLMDPQAAIALSYYHRAPFACAITADRFAGAAIPAGTRRLLVVLLTGDDTDLAGLGHETGRTGFSWVQLVTLAVPTGRVAVQ